ncbi:hypothetical protein GCM10009678_22480 [Actinomadura kijaniata]
MTPHFVGVANIGDAGVDTAPAGPVGMERRLMATPTFVGFDHAVGDRGRRAGTSDAGRPRGGVS